MNNPTAVGVVLALVLVIGALQPARAQVESREGIALQNQMLDLRRQMQLLQEQVGRGGGGGGGGQPTYLGRPPSYPPPSSGSGDLVTQLLARVEALEEQVRQLRGRVDETQNLVQRQGADLAKRIDDMAFQTQNPQAGGPPPPRGPSSPPPSSPSPYSPPPSLPPSSPPPSPSLGGGPSAPPPSGPVRRTPELAIQEANAALGRHDFPAAEQVAREVLAGNRTSPRAYDAKFVLAQALEGQGKYSQAVIAYDDTYNSNRKGSRAPDAMVGLAVSLAALNDKQASQAACETLGRVNQEFGQPRPDLRARMDGARKRAGCK